MSAPRRLCISCHNEIPPRVGSGRNHVRCPSCREGKTPAKGTVVKPLVKPVASGTELVVHQETIASVAETIVPIAESTAPVADTIPPREETIALADAIDHPAHYHVGTYEAINVIEAWDLGFHLGNVVKYVARAGHKGSRTDDLRKARWYLERAIAQEEQRAL